MNLMARLCLTIGQVHTVAFRACETGRKEDMENTLARHGGVGNQRTQPGVVS